MGKQKKKEKFGGSNPPTVPSFQAEEEFPSLGSSSSSSSSSRSGGGDKKNSINTNSNSKSSAVSTTSSSSSVQSPNPPPSTTQSLPPPPPPTLLSSSAWLKHTSSSSSTDTDTDTDTDTVTIKSPSGTTTWSSNTLSPPDITSPALPEVSPWCVHATKGGKIPLQVEKRRHKSVSVIRNITGDPSSLLSSLKLALGTGGKLVDSAAEGNINSRNNSSSSSSSGITNTLEIEVQGDHVKRIAKFLCTEHTAGGGGGVLKGVSKAELATHMGSAGGATSSKNKQSGGSSCSSGSSGGGGGRSIAKLDEKAAQLKQKNGRKHK